MKNLKMLLLMKMIRLMILMCLNKVMRMNY